MRRRPPAANRDRPAIEAEETGELAAKEHVGERELIAGAPGLRYAVGNLGERGAPDFFAPAPTDGELGFIELSPTGAAPLGGVPITVLAESVGLSAAPGLYDIHVRTSTGRGSDIMVPMAIPSFGGMLIEVVTMLVVPVLYCWIQESRLSRR